jgi:lipoate-protein ligase A
LVLDGEAPGPWNMGVDEALLASAIDAGVSTLRLYRWCGPWLSLGYAQKFDREKLATASRAGVGLVRRVTGGRAVLHGGDLTYAIAAPDSRLPPGLRGSYEHVAAALREALASLGVVADAVTAAELEPRPARFDCFADLAADEICVAGRKLVGSAQRRVAGGVLQHGSIRMAADPPGIRAAVGLDPHGSTSLREIGLSCPEELLIEAVVSAFSRALGGPLIAAPLTAAESRMARNRGPEPAPKSAKMLRTTPRGTQERISPTDR